MKIPKINEVVRISNGDLANTYVEYVRTKEYFNDFRYIINIYEKGVLIGISVHDEEINSIFYKNNSNNKEIFSSIHEAQEKYPEDFI